MANTFGDRLARARRRKSWSQAELAESLGVHQVTVSNWENDKTEPSDEQRDKLARLLDDEGLGSRKLGSPTRAEVEAEPSPLRDWLNASLGERRLTVGELADKSGLSAPAIYAILSGRITNPRQTTIRRLEEALGKRLPDAAAQEIARESEIKGLGQFRDFDPYSEEERPNCPGIYVFYDISERPIYVGESEDIKRRIREHSEKFWFKPPIVQMAAYVEIKEKELRRQVEDLLLRFLKSNAVLNKQKVER